MDIKEAFAGNQATELFLRDMTYHLAGLTSDLSSSQLTCSCRHVHRCGERIDCKRSALHLSAGIDFGTSEAEGCQRNICCSQLKECNQFKRCPLHVGGTRCNVTLP